MNTTDGNDIFSGKKIEQYGGDHGSKVIYINLGHACNQDCVFCIIKGNEHNFPVMTTVEAKRIITSFLSSGGEMIMFTGGEPLMRGDMAELIAFAETFPSAQQISILTNATFLSEDKLKSIIVADVRDIVSFSISVHSHDPEISFKLTGGTREDYYKTIEAIKLTSRLGKKVSIYHVITKDNYRQLPDFARYVRKEFPQVQSVVLAYPFPQGSAEVNDWIYERLSETKKYVLEALDFFKAHNYHIAIATCGQIPLCVIPGHEISVLSAMDFFTDNVMGTIGKKVFHEFEWSAEEWISKYKNKSPLCAKCVLSEICQGFWKKYVDLFGFDGAEPINEDNFSGNKIEEELRNDEDLSKIKSRLDRKILNLVVMKDAPERELFLELKEFMKSNQIYVVFSRAK